MSYKKRFSINKNIHATSAQRFAHYIIDIIVIYAIIFFFINGLAFITVAFDSYAFVEWSENMSDFEEYLVFSLFLLSYFISIETFTSQSLAKYITGTIVVLEDGSKPDFTVITRRALCRLIPFDPLSFFTIDTRGWHDSFSDTYVVNKKRLETMMKLYYEFEGTSDNQ